MLCLLVVTTQSAPAVAQNVLPFANCVEDTGGGYFKAYFGYNNFAAEPETIEMGADNIVLQPPFYSPGLPTVFEPGNHNCVFSTRINPGIDLVAWYLKGQIAVATIEHQSCDSVLPLDNYRCYDAREKTTLGPQVADLEDDFAENAGVKVGKAKLLCAPVDINGEGGSDPETYLTCYEIKTSLPRAQEVDVANQFGAQTLLIKDAKLLCVPS